MGLGVAERDSARRRALVAFVFGMSGVAALVYQVSWQRILAFQSGVGIDSVAMIVAAFMAGIGLGSYFGGRMSARVSASRALVIFAGIEILLGLFASVSCWFYYDLMYARYGGSYGAGAAWLQFLTLLPPTALMGMSLPFLVRASVRDSDTAANTISVLYGINVLGAATGALLTPWFLIRFYGIEGAVFFGAACNFAAGLAVLALGRRDEAAEAQPATQTEIQTGRPPAGAEPAGSQSFALWAALYGLSGFCALALEILWFRIVDVAVKSTAFTFGTVLAIYLIGLGAGSVVGGRVAARFARPLEAFLTLQCALLAYASLATLVLVALPEETPLFSALVEFWRAFEGFRLGEPAEWKWIATLYIGFPLFLYGPPTFLMGLSFAVLQRAVHDDVRTSGRKVGVLQSANIAGNVMGSLLTGFVLLSWLGTAGSLRLLLVVGIGFAVLGIYRYGARGRFGALAAALLVLLLVAPDGDRLWSRLHGERGGPPLFDEDGTGVVAITPEGDVKVLSVNGEPHSRVPFGRLHTFLGVLPAAVHPDPADVAVVGLGSGDTAWGAGFRVATKRLVVFEIVKPEHRLLTRLASGPFPQLKRFLNDPRLDLRHEDGRIALLRNEERYDVIAVDALRPHSAYSGNLNSVEFYQMAARRLKPGGVMCTWVPTARVRASFLRVFPQAVNFARGRVLVGSLDPLSFEPELWAERLRTASARAYLGGFGQFIASTAAEARIVPREALESAEVNRDLFPKDEFRSPE